MFLITKSTMNAVNPLTNMYFFAAGYGLKQAKCPAARNVHEISTERFFQTSKEYQTFVQKCQAIPKINLAFLVDKFARLELTLISLGCRRRLRNYTLLITLPGTVSNELNARQLIDFARVSLKGSLKLLKNIQYKSDRVKNSTL